MMMQMMMQMMMLNEIMFMIISFPVAVKRPSMPLLFSRRPLFLQALPLCPPISSSKHYQRAPPFFPMLLLDALVGSAITS